MQFYHPNVYILLSKTHNYMITKSNISHFPDVRRGHGETGKSEAGKSDVLAEDENRHQLPSVPLRGGWCCLCNLQIQGLLMLF